MAGAAAGTAIGYPVGSKIQGGLNDVLNPRCRQVGSRPYYALEGPFALKPQFSETLLFSGLLLAPRALSGLISHDVERRLVRAAKDSQVTYFGDARDAAIIRVNNSKRLAPWALVYPSTTLRIRANAEGSLVRVGADASRSD